MYLGEDGGDEVVRRPESGLYERGSDGGDVAAVGSEGNGRRMRGIRARC